MPTTKPKKRRALPERDDGLPPLTGVKLEDALRAAMNTPPPPRDALPGRKRKSPKPTPAKSSRP